MGEFIKQMNYISCTFKFNRVESSKKTNVEIKEVNSNIKSCIKLMKFLLKINNDYIETFPLARQYIAHDHCKIFQVF